MDDIAEDEGGVVEAGIGTVVPWHNLEGSRLLAQNFGQTQLSHR